jgi:hypothetical protein
MSDPTRYYLYAGLECHAFAKAEAVLKFSVEDDGMWVKWEDYARLKALTAEMDKTINISQAGYRELKAEVERLTNNCDYLDQKLDEEIDKSAMLCGQVERLTKAGDNLERILTGHISSYEVGNASHEWRAAKEGKTK